MNAESMPQTFRSPEEDTTTEIRRILLIDDNPAIHDDIKKIFAGSSRRPDMDELEQTLFGEEIVEIDWHRYHIDSAMQGEEGLSCVVDSLKSGCPYCLAIVDMRMPPGWDGLRTIEEIWKADDEIQIIICTAYSDYNWQTIVSRLGLSDRLLILKKPFDNIELIQMVNAVSEKWILSGRLREQLASLDTLVEKRTRELQDANQMLQYQASHDSLTHLINRQEFELRLASAVESTSRHSDCYCLFYVDLDHFKTVNDNAGHAAGDDLLVEIASILRNNVRHRDDVGRIGGDEFLILLKASDRAGAEKVAISIIRQITEIEFERNGRIFDLACSIGIVIFRNSKLDTDALINLADGACYEAKNQGRARYVVLEPGNE